MDEKKLSETPIEELREEWRETYRQLYYLQEHAEKEHNCSDPLERAYWQGCKDGLRRAIAMVGNDAEWLNIINSAAWASISGHKNINDIPPLKVRES